MALLSLAHTFSVVRSLLEQSESHPDSPSSKCHEVGHAITSSPEFDASKIDDELAPAAHAQLPLENAQLLELISLSGVLVPGGRARTAEF